jgi:hypothetical protein
MKYLITLGCSWTYGAGVGYTEGMSLDDFKNVVFNRDLAEKYSFRNLLAEKYGYKNINFSIHKSSNKKQFRQARNFFSSDIFNKLKNNAEDIIVLWGTTSTGRNEVFSTAQNEYINFLMNHSRSFGPVEDKMSTFFFENTYDHNHEIFELAQDMAHWNSFFKMSGIKNYWFDSFNHHDYTLNSPGEGKDYVNNTNIENFAIVHNHARDLMSQLALTSGITEFDSKYHTNTWESDTNRAELLSKTNLINPFSFHPTKQGHEKIATMMSHLFE